ncbi:hypothetical protein L593_05890 [Salinarchaeum sp. Harcht-Bsk1]|uniref:creatininase family protein n=1 Tax=Salinarchaeum sp. Harcht-Bsk1 TaxID=1333523 RepID=UPI0003423272|nr:creatininase family protein [Salinarchaeum sp. Harcht-Bsk1]AGN01127.1 hypothetical protein L593_05890 [Salinarchaeum sp. Harcht-Bsk1]
MHLDPATSLAARPAPKIRAVAAEPGSILVVPVGSVEQHGEHLPVATDSLLAEAIAHGGVAEANGGVAEATGADGDADGAGEEATVPALVAPAVWTGYSPHHLPFGGTLTLGFQRLLGVLEDLAESGLGAGDDEGFDAILLVNGHGGNASLVDGAVSTIGVANPDAEVVGVTYFELAAGLLEDVRESDPGGMAHGGEFETSLMLHLHPDLVGEDQPAEPLETPYERGGTDLLEGGPVSTYRSFDAFSESGAIGEPEYASAKAGGAIFELLTEELASLLGEIHDIAR